MKIVYCLTVAFSAVTLIRRQPAWFRQKGCEVTIVTSPGRDLERASNDEAVDVHAIEMRRSISPIADLIALYQLIRFLWSACPDVVNASTPKAGLLGTIAAWICRVPCRVYMIRGLRLETTTGLKYVLLWISEWLACRLSTHVLAISRSLAQEVSARGIFPSTRITVLGCGSSNGISRELFDEESRFRQAADSFRKSVSWGRECTVIGFAGRLTRDKGIADLVNIFRKIHADDPTVRLLLVGGYDDSDSLPEDVVRQIEDCSSIHVTGFVPSVACYLPAIDIHVFPSFREGFGNVVLEAACFSVPTVGYAATGTVDAVVDHATGILVPVGDQAQLEAAVRRYISEPSLREQHGTAARNRAQSEFDPERIWSELYHLYLLQIGGNIVEPEVVHPELKDDRLAA